jgi:hypothetical protein
MAVQKTAAIAARDLSLVRDATTPDLCNEMDSIEFLKFQGASVVCNSRTQLGKRQHGWISILLQLDQACSSALAQTSKIEAKGNGACPLKPTKTLTKQHRGTTQIATLKMHVRNGDLQDALQQPATRIEAFMPQLLEGVVAGVPIGGIEKPDGLPKTGISHQALFLRTGLWGHAVVNDAPASSRKACANGSTQE